jgi:hypothetical protein
MSEVMHAAALECFFIDFAPRARSDTDDDIAQS